MANGLWNQSVCGRREKPQLFMHAALESIEAEEDSERFEIGCDGTIPRYRPCGNFWTISIRIRADGEGAYRLINMLLALMPNCREKLSRLPRLSR
jgi:hypothetical protein